jgi:hypothetical protein
VRAPALYAQNSEWTARYSFSTERSSLEIYGIGLRMASFNRKRLSRRSTNAERGSPVMATLATEALPAPQGCKKQGT